ncbi:MAG: GNAT family N-acetyltransferase [candidate division Zixibacteria bacterium]|nr:GNAT family N-acetyltransferase [candidate division Zixibacteria bacterium]
MDKQPILKTKRLVLRPFNLDDAPQVQKLAGDKEIARTTLLIPHPYKDSDAKEWIITHKPMLKEDKSVTYAVILAETDDLIGAIGLTLSKKYEHAELGYWIGVPYWGKGFCTEAANGVLKYGFNELGLHRIFAHHMTSNPASGKVMDKIGMLYEGCCRQHVKRWDEYHDIKLYGILKSDYNK